MTPEKSKKSHHSEHLPEAIVALGNSGFFRDLSAGSIRLLAQLCVPRTVARRARLFSEGEKGGDFFVLVSGSLRLSKDSADGQETVIKMVSPGEVFAEVILFEEDRYPVTATALGESLVYAIPRQPFCALLRSDEGLMREFLGMLMRRQRYLARQIQALSRDRVEDRLLHFLASQYGPRSVYELTLNKKDIAAAIQTTPETLSRVLSRLERAGRVERRGRTLRVRGPETRGKG